MLPIVEALENARSPLISYEIIPPKRGTSMEDVMRVVDDLVRYEPPFIDVTSHAAQAYYEELPDGTIRRRVRRKRPGTLGLCATIQARYGIAAVPHLLCAGFTREETEDALIELHYLGVNNIMALRGDENGDPRPISSERSRNESAADLVRQIADMNAGHYLEDLLDARGTDFCVGVAGYPEKHIAAPNRAWDLAELKRKVDAGAHYIVTQMFFDNRHYFRFVEECRAAGITVPIVPGLKVLTTEKHLTSLPKSFFLDMPEELVGEVQASPQHAREIGIRWAIRQGEELLGAGVPYLHFYILQSAVAISRVVESLRKAA
ncbi:MAG: methylenetetrahydrofolate reductase [Bacteroidetes bacterium]|nr:methylenetetrahydrofolate reductase [Bacteroidota bacterium]